MKHSSFTAVALLAATLNSAMLLSPARGQTTQKSAPAAVVATTQPSVADVQTAIDARQYAAAVKITGKLLALHGPAAAGMSRFQILMLKGDAQAGMKTISAAITTYKSAAKETQDPHELALSKWTAELFHTAASTTYTPKMLVIGSMKRGPFDLMNTEQRKAGFGALLEDNLSALDPKLKAATVTQSLPQIWPVLQQVVELAQLDEIANGSDDKTTAIASGLLDHSRNLLNNVLKEYWARLGDIDAHANATTLSQVQQSGNGSVITQTVTRKNGLSDINRSELKDMVNTSKKIHEAAETLMQFAKNDQGWNSILTDSTRIGGRANDVLTTDYGTAVNTTDSTSLNNGYGNIGYGNGGTVIIVPGKPVTTTGTPGKKPTPTTRKSDN